MCKDHAARHVTGCLGRPALDGSSQLGRAVRVSVEQHEHGAAIRLHERQSDGLLHAGHFHEPVARSSNGLPDIHSPDLSLLDEAAQQDWERLYIAGIRLQGSRC